MNISYNILVLCIGLIIPTFMHTKSSQHHEQQAIQGLRAELSRIDSIPSDSANREALYLDYIRILLDPAYLELPLADRKTVDTIYNQFKNLHATIGKTFMPILPQEGINNLKFLVAKAIDTIHSPAIRQAGGITFKNRVEFIIKSLMSIGQNQNSTENQIRFQWIKPLYLDNDMLTADSKKKLFNLFDNSNYQRWYVSTKNLTLKTAPSSSATAPAIIPDTSEPVITSVPTPHIPLKHEPLTITEKEEIISVKPKRPLPQTPTTTTTITTQPSLPTPSTKPMPKPPVQPKLPVQQPATEEKNTGELTRIAQNLITQSLVAPITTIQNILSKIQPREKFYILTVTDDSRYTALHAASSLARADVIALLLQDLTPNQRFEIIKLQEQDGQTALHLVASAKSAPQKGFKPAVAVAELLKDLTQQQKNELITLKDNSGTTAADIAEGFNKNVTEVLMRNLQK